MTTIRQKTALITGADAPMGRAVALGLASAGWQIAVHYQHSEREAQTLVDALTGRGHCAVLLAGDLAGEAEARQLLQNAAALLGPVSCVINHATLAEHDDASNFSCSMLEAHMRVNLATPILLAQALHASTPDGAQSVAINLLDQRLFNLEPDYLSYTLSKAALHTATTLLARALAPKVRVLGIAPPVALPPASAVASGAHLEDIVAAVRFAAESAAVTGTVLLVDGGQHLLPPPHLVIPN